MKKVFVFCIGGTGERVMKSITMLMAAGMSTHGFTVVPIIVDPHLDLDEKKNLQTLIDKYVEIHQEASEDRKSPKGFFEAEMTLINTLDTQTNNTNKAAGENRSYAEFLNVIFILCSSIPNNNLPCIVNYSFLKFTVTYNLFVQINRQAVPCLLYGGHYLSLPFSFLQVFPLKNVFRRQVFS